MKHILILITCSLLQLLTVAQTAEDSVKVVVNTLFDGMKAGDEAKINSAFSDSALLQSVNMESNGKVSIKNEPVKKFAAAIGKMAKGDADEQIRFENIKIDGPLASVWTPYKFYYKGVFSHCGVDSYQLVRINGNWKIQYLIDTRRKAPCE